MCPFQATRSRPTTLSRCLSYKANIFGYCHDHNYLEIPTAAVIALKRVEVSRKG